MSKSSFKSPTILKQFFDLIKNGFRALLSGFKKIINKLFDNKPKKEAPTLKETESQTKNTKTALQLHVAPFAKELPNGNLAYNGESISERLSKVGAEGAALKGPIISAFNAKHSNSSCPFIKGGVLPNGPSMAQSLHLGTARVWDKEGKIDEARLTGFIEACGTAHETLGQIFTLQKVKNYLSECSKKDLEQLDTGRNTSSLLSSRSIQETAAIKAWEEVFNSYKTGVNNKEPYLDRHSIELFFRDTGAFVLEAEERFKKSCQIV